MARTLVYQMNPFAWEGLSEMTEHLKRVKELGADYVWLGPLYVLPTYDDDFGIDGYRLIDRRFGTMQDYDDFVSVAHKLNLKILMELSIDPVYPYSTYDNPQWFNDKGRINRQLVRRFRNIVKFWLREHRTDGFYLRLSLNVDKNLVCDQTKERGKLSNDQVVDVINAIFGECFHTVETYDGRTPCLMMECYDPTFGNIVDYFYCYTMVDFIMNSAVRDSVDGGVNNFKIKFDYSLQSTGFMLNLESPNSPRFTTRSGLTATGVAEIVFTSNVNAVCIYQGLEIDAKGPMDAHLQLEKYQIPSSYRLYCLVAKDWRYGR